MSIDSGAVYPNKYFIENQFPLSAIQPHALQTLINTHIPDPVHVNIPNTAYHPNTMAAQSKCVTPFPTYISIPNNPAELSQYDPYDLDFVQYEAELARRQDIEDRTFRSAVAVMRKKRKINEDQDEDNSDIAAMTSTTRVLSLLPQQHQRVHITLEQKLRKFLPPVHTHVELMLPTYKIIPYLSRLDFSYFIDITAQCSYTFSSQKYNNGLKQLLSSNLAEYWQSDGPAPHSISVQFPTQQTLAYVALYIDRQADDSYSPNDIFIKTGLTTYGLKTVAHLELAPPPTGWIVVPLQDFQGYLAQLDTFKPEKQYEQNLANIALNKAASCQKSNYIENEMIPYNNIASGVFPNTATISSAILETQNTANNPYILAGDQPNELKNTIDDHNRKISDIYEPSNESPHTCFKIIENQLNHTEIPPHTTNIPIKPAQSDQLFNIHHHNKIANLHFSKRTAFHLSLEIASSFQLGRDCRVHCLRIFAYKPQYVSPMSVTPQAFSHETRFLQSLLPRANPRSTMPPPLLNENTQLLPPYHPDLNRPHYETMLQKNIESQHKLYSQQWNLAQTLRKIEINREFVPIELEQSGEEIEVVNHRTINNDLVTMNDNNSETRQNMPHSGPKAQKRPRPDDPIDEIIITNPAINAQTNLVLRDENNTLIVNSHKPQHFSTSQLRTFSRIR